MSGPVSQNGWTPVAEPEFSRRRDAARERLRERRRRAEGFDTPLPDLPDGEMWLHDDGLAVWMLRADDRWRVGDIAVGDHTAAQVWAALLALAKKESLAQTALFSTFLRDGAQAE